MKSAKIIQEKLLFFFKNSLVNKSLKVLLLRVLGVLLFFSLTLFLTNNFDPDSVGQYDLSRSLLMFMGGICVFGMHQSVVYYSGYLQSKKATDNLKLIYKKMAVIVLFLALIILAFFYLIDDRYIDWFFEKKASNLVLKTIATLFFYSITMLNIDVFRAINKIYLSELYRNVFRYLPFLIAVIAIYYMQNQAFLVDVFLLNFIFLSVVSSLMLVFFFSKKNNINHQLNFTYKSIILRSGPMAVSAIAYILMQSVDIILLSKFTDFKMVAFYSVALKLTAMISLVLASVNTVQAPKIAELFSLENFEELNLLVRKSTRLILAFTFPCVIFLLLFSSFVLKLFGEDYVIAQTALLILLVGQFVNALCGSVGVYLNMTGRQNVLQKILLLAFVLNLILNWVLIPLYGINGAAFATSFSMILWKVITVVYIYKKDKIKTFFTFR